MQPWELKPPQLKPCPNCGKQPKLVQMYTYEGRGLYKLWYECRKWLGLRVCHRSPEHWIEKDWYSLGHREAIRKWNESGQWLPTATKV